MKYIDIFKYFFITIFCVSILIFILKVVTYHMEKNNDAKPFIVSLFWKKSYKTLDPARISYINEAILIDNLYRNLIAYDDYGNLITDLADNFFWNGSSYVFQFSEKKLTSKGKIINSDDALYSFKRLMLIDGNSHGRLKKYICGSEELKNINDNCVGLRAENGQLIITPNNKIAPDLLLNLFTGIDFKIIPKDAFQQTEPYKIFDYTNTTGAYFINSDSEEIEASFSLNPNFEDANQESPKFWTIKSSNLSEKASKIGSEIDLITTASLIDWGQDSYESSNLSVFESLPIAIELIVFTQNAQSSLSITERAYVGAILREFLEKKLEINKKETYQFFPKDSVGYISRMDEDKLISILGNQTKPKRLVKVGFPKSVMNSIGDLNSLLKHNIQIEEFEFSQFLKNSDGIDAMYTLTDTSVQEELTLLEYNFNFGLFGVPMEEAKGWLSKYVISIRTERANFLKDFHFKILSDLKIIPLYAMPYYAVTTKDKTFKMSPQSASTKIWKIQSKNLIF